MLVLLSSAPPNRPRYADDIIRVLGLPAGGQMQFRYAREWVAPDVIDGIPREGLAGDSALICFLSGNGSDQPFEIIPIRFARLIRAELVGTSCVFIFEASAFVSGISDEQVRLAVDSSTRAKLPGPAPASDAYFAFGAKISAPAPAHVADLMAFEQTVAQVAARTPFSSEDTVFFTLFRVSRAYKSSWFGTWPKPVQPIRALMGAYALASGKRFECEVYCLRPNDPDPGKARAKLMLRISPNDDQLAFVSATHGDVDSRYDVKRFAFQSDTGIFDRLTGFRLFVATETENAEGRDIAIPVVLRRSLLLGPVKAILIAVATAGTAMLAANAAGKLNGSTALLLVAIGMLAGIAAVFPSVRKP